MRMASCLAACLAASLPEELCAQQATGKPLGSRHYEWLLTQGLCAYMGCRLLAWFIVPQTHSAPAEPSQVSQVICRQLRLRWWQQGGHARQELL